MGKSVTVKALIAVLVFVIVLNTHKYFFTEIKKAISLNISKIEELDESIGVSGAIKNRYEKIYDLTNSDGWEIE